MDFLSAYCTDTGPVMKVNQDSLCIHQAHTHAGGLLFAAVCDGLGGLAQGELASASVIRAFSEWFTEELPRELENGFSPAAVEVRWRELAADQNRRIADYGRRHGIRLGTTLTAALFVDAQYLLVAQVGDTRAYCIGPSCRMLTDDQTVVWREVQRGQMSAAEAEKDPRRNVLLQCIGATRSLETVIRLLPLEPDCVYLLCSDGFRHNIAPEELAVWLSPDDLQSEDAMTRRAARLAELNKSRGEQDNITALLIKPVSR